MKELNNFRKFLSEDKKSIGSLPIPSKDFKQYMTSYAREIAQDKKLFSKDEWAVAKEVAKYLLTAETPTTVDEYITWHDGVKKITGGESFGMGSGFADASDGPIVDILTDDPNLTAKMADKIDIEILPYIEKKAM